MRSESTADALTDLNGQSREFAMARRVLSDLALPWFLFTSARCAVESLKDPSSYAVVPLSIAGALFALYHGGTWKSTARRGDYLVGCTNTES